MGVERTEPFLESAADVWTALRAVPGSMKGLKVTNTDDAGKSIDLSTGMSAMTWGARHRGTVSARGDSCELRLSGKAKLWSAMGNMRIKQTHQEIIDAIRASLTRQKMR